MSEGDTVTLSGFGSFQSRVRKARPGRDPRTGEDIQLPETTVPLFKAGKHLREVVNV